MTGKLRQGTKCNISL